MAHALGQLLVHARGPIAVIEEAQQELKDYEAAVEALERIQYTGNAHECQSIARVALARLRDSSAEE